MEKVPGKVCNIEVRNQTIKISGVEIFYREAGRVGAPVILLPHGYPSSSYQFRNLLPLLADRWHLIAPDFPGFGYSETPDNFDYSFAGYARFLEQFKKALNIERYSLYLHDYGSQIGLRLAMHEPECITSLIIQNGDIYEDTLGPKYKNLKKYWDDPTPKGRQKLRDAVSEKGFQSEFLGELAPDLQKLIPPDLWKLSWSVMTEKRIDIMVGLMEGLKDNLNWFPCYQAYLKKHQPATLIIWGPQDGYMPETSARAYLRDLPNAEFHLLKGGHWALETNLEEVAARIRKFLDKTQSSKQFLKSKQSAEFSAEFGDEVILAKTGGKDKNYLLH